MPPIPESKRLARAVRRHGIGLVGQYAQKVVKAQVVTASPLLVELLGNDVEIDAEHLLLGAWPRFFDRVWGIAPGDTVLLTRLNDGNWYVIDVLTQSDLAPVPPPTALVVATGHDGMPTPTPDALQHPMWSWTMPGGTISPERIVRITPVIWADSPAGGDMFSVVLKYGAHTYTLAGGAALLSVTPGTSSGWPVLLSLDDNDPGRVMFDTLFGGGHDVGLVDSTSAHTLSLLGAWNYVPYGGSGATPPAAATAVVVSVSVELLEAP